MLILQPTAVTRKGYCGLQQTLQMAKRIKVAGMKFLLDFHYSDNWADPGKQYKPCLEEPFFPSTHKNTSRLYKKCIGIFTVAGHLARHGANWQ